MDDSSINTESWVEAALTSLFAARNADGGWPYRAGQASATEPTALTLLALAGENIDDGSLSTAVDWLLARQGADGLFTASVNHRDASWFSPLAGLAIHRQGYTAASQSAVDALLEIRVFTLANADTPSVFGYDTSIPGWPWTPGDFSFTEPTCLAMIFLKRLGYFDSARVRDGARMLRDRALPGGGWNYGEPQVLGGDLFPTVTPTALALLALIDEPDDITAAGLNWLLAQRGRISSLPSLGWATTALNVIGQLDNEWRTAVVGRWEELPPVRRGPMETSLCLLGLTDRQNHPLGVL